MLETIVQKLNLILFIPVFQIRDFGRTFGARTTVIRRQSFTKISIAILFGAIGLIGFIIHNSVAIVTTKFGLNLFLSNCLGFLLANIFTVRRIADILSKQRQI